MNDQELINRYQLPSLDNWHEELGPFDTEDKGLLLTLIEKLTDKSNKFTTFLEEMLHPDSSITSMQEASVFSNEEREALFALFKRLTFFQRKSLLIQLSSSEGEKAQYLKEFLSSFQSCKNELKQHIEKALSVWSAKEINTSSFEGYFG
ncbi:MAG: hypothetical protein KC535_01270 [Nanoarchaeota archaeon]|nr:hypothetical protein [Nanoarchaeota archaeon]